MIETLFPEAVSTASCSLTGDITHLLPKEAALVRDAVPSRQSEFAAGRLCARRALARLGIHGYALLSGKGRFPLWPDGIVGSLTHCPGYSAAAVAPRSLFAGIGLDAELAEPLDNEMLEVVCTPSEIAWLRELPSRGLRHAKIVFSAKESVFKCVYPLTGVFVDFLECEVRVKTHEGRFFARLEARHLPSPWNHASLEGRFACDELRIFTGLALAASRTGEASIAGTNT